LRPSPWAGVVAVAVAVAVVVAGDSPWPGTSAERQSKTRALLLTSAAMWVTLLLDKSDALDKE
jgi:hypothetical protein